MPKLDMSRCELSCPSTTGRQGDKTSWRKAIRNAAAQNEHLLLRNVNLQLMEEYAPAVYLRYNKELETLLHCEEKQLRKACLLPNYNNCYWIVTPISFFSIIFYINWVDKSVRIAKNFNRNLELREEVMEIHSRRRKSQMEAGMKLKDLEQNWVQMVTKNYKMELACQELAADNEVLAKKAKLIA
ncbi:unnamed protein product [Gongylonema pulchrum]|uniref:Pre-mRNA-splicing factor SPF27 n=1 Tax=Gongylonema pulchrum TaxID=637853 RepID=A0A183D8T5_9BILA|nr:unnamed protein product [Gongylonema pulchrum]